MSDPQSNMQGAGEENVLGGGGVLGINVRAQSNSKCASF